MREEVVHLTLEDAEKYLDTNDVSSEYLQWFNRIHKHMEECNLCQTLIREMIKMQEICSEENIGYGLRLLAKEDAIRRRLQEVPERTHEKEKA